VDGHDGRDGQPLPDRAECADAIAEVVALKPTATRPSPFDALIFDVGGVIVPHDNGVLHRRLAGRCPVPHAEALVGDAARDPRYETGELPIGAFHERLRREAGYPLAWDAFVADWCCHLGLDLVMLDFVERLAAANRVILFSNTNREHWQHLLRLSDGRLGRFEANLSHEIGEAKPPFAAFAIVAARAAIDPVRCLFIDDRAANVEAARLAGFRAELFTDQATLERHLAAGTP
jgi:FMN phosphatase YigB (HAD superfamily)